MKLSLTIAGLLLFCFVSCKKADTDIISKGLYVENSPVAGRSQLAFITNSMVVRSETGSNYKDTFSYTFSAGKIILTPTWTNQYTGQQFDFKKIDDNTFQIENLYPSIPEAPKSYMTYKK